MARCALGDKAILPVALPEGDSSTTPLLGHSLSPTMIRSNLSPPPTFPTTFWNFVPLLFASVLALRFTALLVLVENDSNDGKMLVESHSSGYQRRVVRLHEEHEWAARSYYVILLSN
jgi:hypothetical protein